MEELISVVTQRMGTINDDNRPQLLYEDDEGDRVILGTDGNLTGAVSHARSISWIEGCLPIAGLIKHGGFGYLRGFICDGPRQRDGKQCGIHAMRFMRDIMSDPSPFPFKINKMSITF
ncbi:hypothetical protein IFM89_012076 [Coptis chinensis]|uniref:PB1 domain-containing protein n=1 Tax=Coptis chinensis TaxID=261450 RepID=A0A835I4C4_9MAGN|nr:hypothetical protein IFM89_012076 [Coptis chinensis]